MKGTKSHLLSLLRITPSERSLDYVKRKKSFQLHGLLTEQRHPLTWNLSSTAKRNIEQALKQVFSVDRDISRTFRRMSRERGPLLEAASAVSRAAGEGKKIFIYGCGATGRLAKQMESGLWRPFWKRLRQGPLGGNLETSFLRAMEERLVGEMTGGDRALVSSLEGFEDLPLIGELQLREHGVERGDAVFFITEGGETSSVIGAAAAASRLYEPLDRDGTEEARRRLYFLYNNPDSCLEPLARSRMILHNPAITKINLTTGPQAVAGSTRMQAATAETFVMGAILESGIAEILRRHLTSREMESAGFRPPEELGERLRTFESLRERLVEAVPGLAGWTRMEAEVYKQGGRATYFAGKGLITVFTDCAERSPTFHLYPLDTVEEKPGKSWVRVWTAAGNGKAAWRNLLGREFRGLEEEDYGPILSERIEDPFLRETALHSLRLAGKGQEELYDFSFSERNIRRREPGEGDLGVLVCMDEELEELGDPDSSFVRFASLFKRGGARLACLLVGGGGGEGEAFRRMVPLGPEDILLHLALPRQGDPLRLDGHTLLKMLLNAHSTVVMALLGRVVGNTMTNVNPSNLKLVGRATHLILSHVNDILSHEAWRRQHGSTEPLTYEEANAVLYDALEFTGRTGGQVSEVELSIIRILESLRRESPLSWEKARALVEGQGLSGYLETLQRRWRR